MINVSHESYDADYCTRGGAEQLKARIEAYWRERGYDVRIRLEHNGFVPAMRSARTDVRSNMRNGLPVDLLVDEARKAA